MWQPDAIFAWDAGEQAFFHDKGFTDQPEATEKLKERARRMGLIVNAGSGKSAKPTGQKKGGKK